MENRCINRRRRLLNHPLRYDRPDDHLWHPDCPNYFSATVLPIPFGSGDDYGIMKLTRICSSEDGTRYGGDGLCMLSNMAYEVVTCKAILLRGGLYTGMLRPDAV